MAAYQKFMFDNFVIDDEGRIRINDENASATEVTEPEETEISPQAEVEDAQNTQVEEVVASEPVMEIQEQKEPDIPPPPSFSEDELRAATEKSREEGYEKGFQAAQGEQEKQEHELLENINTRLLSILTEAENFQKQLEQDNLHFVLGVLKKIFPSLAQKQADAELELFLKENFAHFKNEASLSFSFNPESVKIGAALLPKLANANDFEGKIAIHKDASLGVGDCRIEWKNGGVERNADKMLEKVTELLDDKGIDTKERENGQ